MSATAQTNGKKSSNSSIVNTPSSTPVTNGNSQTISQSTPPPPNNNAPKYGTLVPNRIFVGGISASTTEGELLQLFSSYGTVKAAKIIQDRAGVSRGYGFITFESEDDAKRPLKDADNIVLRERKLNIAPAIKKQPFNRAFDASSPSTVTPGNATQYFFPPAAGVPYFQGGVTYYQQPSAAPGDPNSQPSTVYQAPAVYSAQTGPPQAPTYPSMMFPPPIYMPQQYPIPPMPYDFNYYQNNGGPQYMVGGQNGPNTGNGGGSQGPSMPPSTSPPRPQCYNTQLPYNPEPSLYYNMPIYGAPIEGPVYSEGLELANGGYSEVSQLGDYFTGFDGADTQGPYHMGDLSEDIEIAHSPQPPPLTQPPPLYEHETTDADTTRQSKTPVVSLLSMEQHQEKDFVSMQGGRRVKPQPPLPPPQQQIVIPPHFSNQPPPPPLYSYNFNGPPVRSHNQTSYKTANNRDMTNNAWRRPRSFNSTRKSYDHNNSRNIDNSSRSSLRTDSNCSANATVDENKNENKSYSHPGSHPPPPPPPLHPAMMNPSHNSYHFYSGTRTYQNSISRRNFGRTQSMKEPNDNNNKNKTNFVQMRNNSQQNYGMTTAKRNKRTMRRNVQAGGSLSEIGAGDAPLPNNDVTDTCKKMETLKM